MQIKVGELDVFAKLATSSPEDACDVCDCREVERIRCWQNGKCITQLFRCENCGSYRAWVPEND